MQQHKQYCKKPTVNSYCQQDEDMLGYLSCTFLILLLSNTLLSTLKKSPTSCQFFFFHSLCFFLDVCVFSC